MMLWMLVAATCVLVVLLLWAVWRRQPDGAPVSAMGILAITAVVGVAGWYSLGMHDDTPRWLSDYRVHHPLARDLIDGTPDMDALSTIPVGVMATVLQRELQREGSAEGWYALALLYEQMEAPVVAEEAARAAVAQVPDGELAPSMLLARTLLAQGDSESLQEARDVLDGVLQQMPDHEGAHLMLGVVSAQLGDYDTAIVVWEAALERHSDGEAADAIRMALDDARTKRDGVARFGSVRVTIDAEGAVVPGGTLFVFLRHEDMPMGQPLAARRVLADRLPIEVEIGPADWLQDFPDQEQVVLVAGARYAQSPGGAVADAGLIAPVARLTGEPGALKAQLTLSENQE